MKVRIKFEKRGNLRFIGHLDLMRYFQKANRRAGLPIAYSEGFSPHQIMSFAAPLSMGVESTAEYADFKLTDDARITSEEAVLRMNREMAEGLKILSFLRIPDEAGNCMSTMFAADYRVWFPEHPHFLAKEAEELQSACLELVPGPPALYAGGDRTAPGSLPETAEEKRDPGDPGRKKRDEGSGYTSHALPCRSG